MLPRRYRVALLIESSRAYGRGLLRGVARYSRVHGPWILQVEEQTLDRQPPSWLQRWRGDGIIARVESAAIERALRAQKVPVIDVRGVRSVDLPVLDTDNRAVAAMAASHLRERGFSTLAFCGYAGLNYSEERRAAFEAVASVWNVPVLTYESRRRRGGRLQDIEQQGLRTEPGLVAWLRSLPRPVGLFACNDVRGNQVISACREAGILVPQEVGVVGVDDDEILCELSDPTLSSVAPDTDRIGYEAAALLEQLLHGEAAPERRTLIPPRGVVARQSTESQAIADAAVARATWIIRQQPVEQLSVDRLAAAVSLTRRTLERRFQSALGHAPHEEILRVRIERVQELLRTTDWSLAEIAGRSGFDHPEYLSALFKRRTGETPGAYRRRLAGE